jgi:hypothetical protein
LASALLLLPFESVQLLRAEGTQDAATDTTAGVQGPSPGTGSECSCSTQAAVLLLLLLLLPLSASAALLIEALPRP